MSGHRRDGLATRGRRRNGRRQAAALSPLPPPEEVFLDWLLSVPHGADLEAAARMQVELIDRRAGMHPDVERLRVLLVALARDGLGDGSPHRD